MKVKILYDKENNRRRWFANTANENTCAMMIPSRFNMLTLWHYNFGVAFKNFISPTPNVGFHITLKDVSKDLYAYRNVSIAEYMLLGSVLDHADCTYNKKTEKFITGT